MKMSVNTTARLSFNKQPNAASIWATASTELPNNYPVLWDPNIIPNDEFRDYAYPGRKSGRWTIARRKFFVPKQCLW